MKKAILFGKLTESVPSDVVILNEEGGGGGGGGGGRDNWWMQRPRGATLGVGVQEPLKDAW